jgi:hypothetical protein
VIPPGPIVGDIHALFALAGGFDQEAVHIDDGLLEESGRLAIPDAEARRVEDIMQRLNAVLGKASTEIACSRGVGDTAGPQSIEEDFVVAEQLQVLQTGAATQRQISQGEHVVRFMIGEVDLQHLQALVERLNQADVLGEGVQGTDAAAGDTPTAFGNFIVDIAGRHHGLRAAA